jgi:hypothetical protein
VTFDLRQNAVPERQNVASVFFSPSMERPTQLDDLDLELRRERETKTRLLLPPCSP